MKIAIVGSRNFPHMDWVDEFIRQLPNTKHIVISGGARGVDQRAESMAESYGIHFARVPALWEHYGKPAGMKRNQWICKLADIVVAFWDGKSSGTQNTIGIATAKDMPVFVIKPDNRYDFDAALEHLGLGIET